MLFRMAEPEGLIRIDALDIKEMGLHDLRQKLSIIPQVSSVGRYYPGFSQRLEIYGKLKWSWRNYETLKIDYNIWNSVMICGIS